MKGLTTRQAELLEFIECYIEANHTSPTLKECGQFISVNSLNGAKAHLNALNRKGYIELFPGKTQIKVLRNCKGQRVTLLFKVTR